MNDLWQNKHFIITHFPIVLLIFAFVFDVLGQLFKKRDWNLAGLICLVAGTLGAIAAVLTGPDDMRNAGVHKHEMYGEATMYVSIALSLIRLAVLWRWKKDLGRKPVFLIGMLAAAVLVGYTGHLGGEMVHRVPDFPMGQRGGPGGFGGQGPEDLSGPGGQGAGQGNRAGGQGASGQNGGPGGQKNQGAEEGADGQGAGADANGAALGAAVPSA